MPWVGIGARFELSVADMRAFISNSPPLNQAKPEVYNAARHYLSETGSVSHITGFVSDTTPTYFTRHPNWPDWYDPTLRGRGRVYEYWPHWRIILDEEKNIVWLNTGD